MTLINAVMAVGAAAFVVPLAIHLLHRSRVKPVRWGAMHLVSSVVVTHRRQIRLSHWILLLIRCAIPIVLALALARPLIDGLAASPSGDRRGLIVVVDHSASMSVTPAGGESIWQTAIQTAQSVLATAKRSDPVVLITSSDENAAASIGGVKQARSRLKSIQPTGPATTLSSMIRIGINAAADLDVGTTSIVVITDATASTIPASDAQSSRSIADALSDRSDLDVHVISVGLEPATSPNNVYVGPIGLETPVSLAGRAVDWSTTIHNQSDQMIRDGKLLITIGDGEVVRRKLNLQPRSQSRVRWTTPPTGPMVQTMRVEIDAADDWATDNVREIGFETTDPVSAVIVDDSRDQNVFDRAGGYLSIALTPFRSDGRDAIAGRVVRCSKLLGVLNDPSAAPATIFFTDNAKWQSAWIEPIDRFIRDGGQVVVLCGENTEPDFFADHASSIAWPATIGDIITLDRGRATQTNFVAGSPWAVLGIDEGPELEIETLRKLVIAPVDDPTVSPAQVWWRTRSETPLAVARQIGRGRLVQLAIPPDASWSNWPLRPTMLPMIQTMVLDRSQARSIRSHVVGQTVTMSPGSGIGQSWDSVKRDKRAKQWNWVRADGKTFAATIDADGLASTTAEVPGTLSLVAGWQDRSSPTGDFTIVTIDPSESDLRAAGAEAIAAATEQMNATFVVDVDDYRAAETTRREGREIWRPMIFVLLALLIGEIFWQQRRPRIASPAAPSSRWTPAVGR